MNYGCTGSNEVHEIAGFVALAHPVCIAGLFHLLVDKQLEALQGVHRLLARLSAGRALSFGGSLQWGARGLRDGPAVTGRRSEGRSIGLDRGLRGKCPFAPLCRLVSGFNALEMPLCQAHSVSFSARSISVVSTLRASK